MATEGDIDIINLRTLKQSIDALQFQQNDIYHDILKIKNYLEAIQCDKSKICITPLLLIFTITIAVAFAIGVPLWIYGF